MHLLRPRTWRYYMGYTLERSIDSCTFTLIIFSAGLIIATIVTLFAAISVGYEPVNVLYTSYNATAPRWYDRFQSSLLPKTIECQGSAIKVNEGSTTILPY